MFRSACSVDRDLLSKKLVPTEDEEAEEGTDDYTDDDVP